MRREDDGGFAPRWRTILEARWRIRLQEVTELSMAYHAAAAGAIEDRQARRLLRRAVAARRRLADTEEALGRVAAGTFGRCEQCAAPISGVLLAAAPESRYCARCAAAATGPLTARSLTRGTGATGTDKVGTAAMGTGTMGTAAGRR